ncbi:hypothetical protein JCM15519_02930 [Fundidesulfovibrio butyratiphilus]
MSDLLDETLKFTHKVDQRATGLAEDMVRELRAVRADIVGKLAALADDMAGGRDFEALPLARKTALLEAQKAEVERILAQVYATCGDQLHDAGEDVIQASATQTVTVMTELAGTGAALAVGPKLSKDIVTAWFESSTVEGLTINDFLGKLEKNAAERIVSAGRRALIEGKGVAATARMIREEGIEGSVPGLEGLARTYLMSASNYSREKITQEHFAGAVKGWKRVAVLDGRTCLACGSADGTVYPLNEPRPPLPAHWRCRCVYIQELVSWRDMGIPIDELADAERPAVKHDARTVHHKDGSTSTKFTVADVEHTGETYSAWMKRQLGEDPAFVRSVLGKTRFDLFKSGKLSLSGMVTDGRIKKLSEL